MTIQELLKEIKVLRAQAEQDIDAVAIKSRPAFQAQKNQAKQELPKLVAQYEDMVLNSAVAFFVSGRQDQVAKFARTAESDAGTVTVDADELYRNLAAPVEASLGLSREFTVTQLNILLAGLRQVMNDLGVHKMAEPTIRNMVNVATPADTRFLVQNLIESSAGSTLARRYIQRKIAQAAETAGFDGGSLGVVVVGIHTGVWQSLSGVFTKGVEISVPNDQTVNSEYVLGVFEGATKKKRAARKSKEKEEETDEIDPEDKV